MLPSESVNLTGHQGVFAAILPPSGWKDSQGASPPQVKRAAPLRLTGQTYFDKSWEPCANCFPLVVK